MKTSPIIVAMLFVACTTSKIPDAPIEPDPTPMCSSTGTYAVDLALDVSECPTTFIGDGIHPYQCSVASLDPDQVSESYKLDELQCGAASAVTTTWSIYTDCDEVTGVDGAYDVEWPDSAAITGARIDGGSVGAAMALSGTASDGFGQPAMLSATLAIADTVAVSGELVMTFTALDGGQCDEHYHLTATLQ